MMVFRHHTWYFLLLSLCVLQGCFSGSQNSSAEHGGAKGPPPLPVKTLMVTPQDVPVSFEFAGQTAGSREVEVRARVGGILLRRLYEEGTLVREGQPLFQIDPVPLQLVHEQARASVKMAQAKLSQAQIEHRRAEILYADQALSQKERDDTRAVLEVAQAELVMAQARLKDAAIQVSYSRVIAPVTGIASQEEQSEGSLIAPNGPSSLLTKITQFHPLYVKFNMSDSETQQFQKWQSEGKLIMPKGLAVRMQLGDGSFFPQPGRLNFMGDRVDSTTASIRSRAVFPNPRRQIMPGQFVRVHLEGAIRPQVLMVPSKAVVSSQEGKTVWVFNPQHQKAESRPVKLAQDIGGQIIVEEGLHPGDRVIVDNLIKLRPNAPVMDAGSPQSSPVIAGEEGKMMEGRAHSANTAGSVSASEVNKPESSDVSKKAEPTEKNSLKNLE
jgi:membrane fusion protein (multidrug efflux system)